MTKLKRNFRDLLRSHKLDDLQAHSGAIYGIWADFSLAYYNPGWFRFSMQNGGEPHISTEWGLGRSILECMAPEMREFYATNYGACLGSHETWDHEYECSSDTLYRRYHQIVYPLGQREGLLITNSLISERPHDKAERPASAADELAFLDDEGRIVQCAHCRRVKNIQEVERWDWVPEWVKQSPEITSHSICPTCFGYYYPLPADE